MYDVVSKKYYHKCNGITLSFFRDLTENNRDCSWNLHFLFWSVQPHVPSLHTQVNNDFLLLFLNFSRFLTFKILNHQSTSSCSYLGNGLYAARLAILGAKDTDGSVSATITQLPSVPFLTDTRWQTVGFCSDIDHRVFTSSCLPKKFREDVTIFGTTYKISGIPDGKWGKILQGFVIFPVSSVTSPQERVLPRPLCSSSSTATRTKRKHSVNFPNPTVTSPPQRGDQETQGLSLGCYFFVRPVVIWSAPVMIWLRG